MEGMRVPRLRFAGAAAILVSGAVANTASSQDFPYVAYVVRNDAFVRSGPDERHYPTGQLEAGYAVEVFRHDGDRWCAVRPPQYEASLVARQHVRMIDSRVGEIIGDKVMVRVASRLSADNSAVQVVLQPGELVDVAAVPQPQATWVRISPPAGEFRWIDATDLSRDPPTETLGAPGALPGDIAGVAAAGSRWRSPSLQMRSESASHDDAFAHLTPQPLTSAPRPKFAAAAHAAAAASTPEAESNTAVKIVEGSPADLHLAEFRDQEGAAAKQAAAATEQAAVDPLAAPPLIAPEPTSDSLNASGDNTAATGPRAAAGPPRIAFPGRAVAAPANGRIAELQLRLSQAVVEPPSTWNLDGIRAETAALLAQEQAPQGRAQLRDLLERVGVFEQVRQRYLAPPASARLAAAPATPPNGIDLAAPAPAVVAAEAATESNSAAAGQGNVAPPFSPMSDPSPAQSPLEAAAGSMSNFTSATASVRQRAQSDLAGGNGAASDGAPPASAFAEGDPFESSEAKYDAVGTLKPVVSRRANAPRYALVDDQGDVAAFISPAPDVNLSRYIGRRIGVHGNRGFMPDYQRSHVTATRVRSLR